MIVESKRPASSKKFWLFIIFLGLAVYLLVVFVTRDKKRPAKAANVPSNVRVWDDGKKTYIVVEDKDGGAVKVVSRSRQEGVSYQHVDGMYVINRVLKKGEQFKLQTESENIIVSRKD
jgi:type IV secretory pathway VirB9-like protein